MDVAKFAYGNMRKKEGIEISLSHAAVQTIGRKRKRQPSRNKLVDIDCVVGIKINGSGMVSQTPWTRMHSYAERMCSFECIYDVKGAQVSAKSSHGWELA
jgi:hypothetical protein